VLSADIVAVDSPVIIATASAAGNQCRIFSSVANLPKPIDEITCTHKYQYFQLYTLGPLSGMAGQAFP
jgi:hypothetical protein